MFFTVEMMLVPSYSEVGVGLVKQASGVEQRVGLWITLPFLTHGDTSTTGRREPRRLNSNDSSPGLQALMSSGAGAEPVPGGLT